MLGFSGCTPLELRTERVMYGGMLEATLADRERMEKEMRLLEGRAEHLEAVIAWLDAALRRDGQEDGD